jgi:prepilin-type N-terminal cleavage/methylation domain-containing protein
MKKWATKRDGFTIVELLIVVVVIAILATITIVSFNGIQARAKNTTFLANIDAYEKGLRLYYAEHSTYPSTLSGGVYRQVCLGENYVAESGFSANRCGSDTVLAGITDVTSSDLAVMNSVNTQLKAYISPLPDASKMVFSLSGTTMYRGIIYQGGDDNAGNGPFATLNYYVDGDVVCGRGNKQTATVEGQTLTLCSVIMISTTN